MEVGLIIKDQYQVVEHIGRGGMADVWSARDQRLNRLVAIKTISQSLSTEVDPVALFQQEAQTIAQMEHPHILPIYDFGDYRSNLYIVMRYVTGGSLEDKLEEKPLSLQETLQIAGNIAQALDYAHENNVIHLDLKPPNILMDSGGSPYLADFGLATVLDKQGNAQNPGSGTLLYMAPEQLVAEVIDHRADIYSFCVMIFHMLTGTLPFDGMVPLAIKQLQFQDRIPDLDEFVADIPYQITDILRQGTDTEPANRQKSLGQIVDQMRDALQMSTLDIDSSWVGDEDFDGAFGMDSALTVNIDDAGLLEAADIYVRAKHVWSGGNGRFLLGVSHFMMMADYYMEAETHGLELDDMGLQMLLRGALEYDYQVEYWWAQVNDDTRRWVCLHTIRSENAPARIRALYRLETLPDDTQKPVIHGLVANALAIETNKEAKLAALTVLGTRAHFLTPTQSFKIKSEFRGRLLSTSTRLGIEILPQDVWRDAVYAPEIDLLIAKEALNEEDDDVSELAARIIGRIHSLTSLRFIASAQRQNQPNALRALALIRDEAPYLPDVVNRQARLYAWVANTILRITDNPMELVFRFMFALLGGAIAFGQHVYITYRSQALFVPQRWGNTLAVGLMMGLFIAILVMFVDVLMSRLKGFWPNWLRLILSVTFGLLFGTLVWTGFTWLYLNQQPLWELMRMGGFGLAFGLVASTMFSLKSWQSLILTSTSIFLTIFVAYFNFCTQLFFCMADLNFNPVEGITSFSMAPIVLAGFLFGIMLGVFIPHLQPLSDAPPPSPTGLTQYGGMSVLLLLGLGGATVTYALILDQAVITWDHVVLLFVMPMIFSAIAMVILDRIPRMLYMIIGLVGFTAIMLQVQNALTGIDTLIAPQVGADYIDPLFAYDLFWQAFTVALPVSLTISFGAFAMGIFRDLRTLIGIPVSPPERNAWLTGMLIYMMLISGLIAVFAPFSLHQNVIWAIGWTIMGSITFVTTLAAWQWKRWGANGLLICSVLLIAGAFLADYRSILMMSQSGVFPQIFSIPSLIFWAFWAVVTGVMTVGTLRHKLWSAYGLIVMIFLWFIVSIFLNDIGDSLTGLAIVHVPLVAFALRFDWEVFKTQQHKSKRKAIPTPVAEDDTPTTPGLETVIVADEALDGLLDREYDEDSETEFIAKREVKSLDDIEMDVSPDDLDTTPSRFGNGSKAEEDSEESTVDTAHIDTEIDPYNGMIPLEDSKTQLSVDYVAPEQMATEANLNMDDESEDEPETGDKPKLTLNTGKIKDADKPDRGKSKPKLQIDTGLLSSKTEDKPDSKSTRRGLKIDTGLLGSKTDDKPDSKSTRRGLQIDTGLLGSKTDSKPPNSKSTRRGLKIDTGLLGQKSDDTETDDEPSAKEQRSDKDETLPSRKTTKLSTAEIKQQIAEEARQMKAEADRSKEESKPKFTLNTSRIKPNDIDKPDEGNEE